MAPDSEIADEPFHRRRLTTSFLATTKGRPDACRISVAFSLLLSRYKTVKGMNIAYLNRVMSLLRLDRNDLIPLHGSSIVFASAAAVSRVEGF